MVGKSLNLSRRTLMIGSVSAGISPPAFDCEHNDPMLSLWQEWQRSFAEFLQLNEAQYAAGVEEKALLGLTDALLRSPTRGASAIVIKLKMLFELSRIECGGPDEFPFPQLKVILDGIEEAIRPDPPRVAQTGRDFP